MTSRNIASAATIVAFALLALGSAKSGESSGSSAKSDQPAQGQPPGSAAAPAAKAAPAADAFDPLGAEKDWGAIHATLKEASVRGKTGLMTLVLKNTHDKEENISSIMQIQMTSEEGDKGEMDITGTSCDGKVPPNGVLKCKLAYNFDKAPKELTVALGAGIMSKTVYFKYKVGK